MAKEFVVKLRVDDDNAAAVFAEIASATTKAGAAAERAGGSLQQVGRAVEKASDAAEQGTKAQSRLGRELSDTSGKAEKAATSFSSIAGSLGKVGAAVATGGIVVGLAAFGGALASVTSQVGEMARVFREANALNVDSRFLSGLTAAAQAAGRELDDVLDVIRDVRERAGEAVRELDKGNVENIFVDAFRFLGASLEQIRQFATDTEAATVFFFQKAAEAAKAGGADIQQALQEISSGGFEKITPIVSALGGDLDSLFARMENLGVLFDDETGKAAQLAATNFSVIGLAVEGIQRQITAGALPAIVRIGERLDEVVQGFGIGEGGLQAFGAALFEFVEKPALAVLDALEALGERAREVGFGNALMEKLGEVTGDLTAKATEIGASSGRAMGMAFVEGFTTAVQGNIDKNTTGILAWMEIMDARIRKGMRSSNPFDSANWDLSAEEMDRLGYVAQDVENRVVPAVENIGKGARTVGNDFLNLRTELEDFNQVPDNLAPGVRETMAGLSASSKETVRTLASAGGTIRTEFASQLAAMRLSVQQARAYNDALEQVTDASLEGGEAARVLAAVTADAAASKALAAKANQGEAAAVRELTLALDEEARRRQELESIRNAESSLAADRERLDIYTQQAQGLISQRDAAVQIAQISVGQNPRLRAIAATHYEITDQIASQRELIAAQEASYVNLGDTIKSSFSQVFDALIAGTLDLGDAFKSLGLAIGKQFWNAMLEDKLKNFDPKVKGNFLDLGEFGSSIFGDVFGDAATDMAAESISLSDKFGGWVKDLFGADETGRGAFFGLFDAPVKPTEGFVGPLTASGNVSDGGMLSGFSGLFGGGAAGAIAGAGAGMAVSSALGSPTESWRQPVKGFDLIGAAGIKGVVDTVYDVMGAVLGAVGGYFAGPVGGAVGGLVNKLLGELLIKDPTLDNLESGNMGDTSKMPFFGLLKLLTDWVFHIPTRGTMTRRALEPAFNESESFMPLRDRFNRDFSGDRVATFIRPGQGSPIGRGDRGLAAMGLDDATIQELRGQGEAVFAVLGEGFYTAASDTGANKRFFGDAALSGGLMYAEFFGQAVEKGQIDPSEVIGEGTQSIAAFATEMGVSIFEVAEALPRLQEGFVAIGRATEGMTFADAEESGLKAFGRAAAGMVSIFTEQYPAGTQVGLQALQSLTRDGTLLFDDMSNEQQDALIATISEFDNLQDVMTELRRGGFEFDLDELEEQINSAAMSAGLVGQTLGDALLNAGGDAQVAIDSIVNQMATAGLESIFGESMSQLLDTTSIGLAFEDAFSLINNIGDVNFLDTDEASTFRAQMVEAIASGKANLEEYLPVLKEMVASAEELDAAMAEALAPTTAEAFFADLEKRTEAYQSSIKSAISGALSKGLEAGAAVMADGGSFAAGLSAGTEAFTSALSADLKNAVLQSILSAMTEAAVMQTTLAPLLTELEVRTAEAMADGVIDASERAELSALGNHIMQEGERAGKELEPVFEDLFTMQVDMDSVTDAEKHLMDVAAEANLAPADVAAFLSAFEGMSPEQIAAWTEANTRGADTATSFSDKLTENIPKIEDTGASLDSLTGAFEDIFDPTEGLNNEFAKLVSGSIDLGGASEQATGSLTDLAEAAGSLNATLAGSPGVPGAATGGSFGYMGSAVVGEAGMPELVQSTPGGGFTVTPLGWAEANALMAGGIPGFATGTPVGGGRGGVRKTPSSGRTPVGDRGGSTRVSSDDLADWTGAIQSALSNALSEGGRNFADSFAEQFEAAGIQSLIDGALTGLSESSGMQALAKEMDALVEQATNLAASGELTAENAREMAQSVAEKAEKAKQIAKDLEPFLDELRRSTFTVNLSTANFSGLIEQAATEGLSSEQVADAVHQMVLQSTVQAMIEAMLVTGPLAEVIADWSETLSEEFRAALEDGIITDEEAERIKGVAQGAAEAIAPAISAAGEVVAIITDGLRDPVQELEDAVKSRLGSALRDALVNNDPFEVFVQNAEQALYEHVVNGLIDAFIDAVIFQAALAPALALWQGVFDDIANGQIKTAEDWAKAQSTIIEGWALVTGLFDDPAFEEAFNLWKKGLEQLRQDVGITTDRAKEASERVVDTSREVTDQAAQVCTEKCDLAKETFELGEGLIGRSGRRGGIAFEEFVPFARGGIVTSPTLGLVGEAGPEAIIPLSKVGQMGGGAELADEVRQMRGALVRLADAIEAQPAQVDVSVDRQVLITAITKAGRLSEKAGGGIF